MRTWFAVLVTLALITPAAAFLALGGEAGARPAPAARAARTITIDNFTFGTDQVTVARGTEVTWVNRDDMPHTVVSTTKVFESKPLDTGDRFSYTFATPGTYPYYCSIHPRMTGTIVVR